MSDCNLVNFDLTIRGEQAPYRVNAQYQGGSADGEFSEDSTQPAWLAAHHVLGQSIYTPDADGITAIGSRLFKALMRDKVRDLWIGARRDLDQDRIDGLRIRLALHAPAVAALPWESLYDPDRNTPFAAGARTPLVRVEPEYAQVGPSRRLRASLPLKVLIAVPDDPDGALDTKQELEGVRKVIAAIGRDYLSVTVLPGQFGVVELGRQLRTARADVLHFIGHGTPDGLLLWQRGKPALAPAASLRVTLDRTRSVKLAFLNACLAARGSRLTSFSSVGSQLLQAGLPAVIAMQGDIRNDVAVDFAQFLYEELVTGPCPGAIDTAISNARSTLYALNPGDFSYATPVLWLNTDDGRIFIPRDGTDLPAAPHAGSAQPVPDVDLAAERQWLARMAALEVTALPAEYRTLSSKWQNLLDELQGLQRQLAALSAAGEPNPGGADAYSAKLVEYRRYQAALLRHKRLIEDVLDALDR
jgi:hypothetical protein